MPPSDMTVNHKASSLLLLYKDFWYNLHGSICTCYYLFVCTNVSPSASLSKYSSIRCVIEELRRRPGIIIHPWDPDLSWRTPQGDGEHIKESLGRPPPWIPPYETSKGV